MIDSFITYKDVVTKRLVQNWADGNGFDADDQIRLHFEERFNVSSIHVANATERGDFLLLELITDHWEKPREFALLADGGLSW